MLVNVKLISIFQVNRFKQKDREYSTGTKVQDVINDLELPQQHLGIILINGVHADIDTVLIAGDQVVIMPIVDGG